MKPNMKINDWILSGGGMEGDSYTSETHPELIMKVYSAGQTESFVENELRQVQQICRYGVSVPEALEVTQFKGRPALISRRIENKKSFCRLAGESPEMIPELARRMASMVRNLHSKVLSQGSGFQSTLQKYQRLLESNTTLDGEAKSQVRKALSAIEGDDRPVLLHGDLHFGNIITDGSGDYFIDLGDVSTGHPNHDLAMFYITTHYGSDNSFRLLYHITWEQALEFWEVFKNCYYGHAVTDREVFDRLRNYMLSRSVWFKHDQIQTNLCSLLSMDDCPLRAEIILRDLG